MDLSNSLRLSLLSKRWGVTLGEKPLVQRPVLTLFLGFISLHDHEISRHHLAELFWPDEISHAKRLKRLGDLLRAIRQTHPKLIQKSRDHACVSRHPSLWCDVHALHSAYQSGDLSAVMRLYKAPLLQGIETLAKFPLAERDELRQWLFSERDHIMGLVLQTGLELAEGEALREEWHTATLWAKQTLSHIDAALFTPDLYKRFYDVLLACNTSASAALTQELYKTRTTHSTHKPLPQTKEQARLYLAQKHNLSLPPLLIGREEEVKHITHTLLESTTRFLSLVGMPGIGKTSLAHHIGYTLLGRFPFRDGVYWLSLASLRSPEEVAFAISQVLNLPLSHNKYKDQLLDALKAKSLLLILDNCEHLLHATSLLISLLDHCPYLTILTTTQQPFQLDLEQTYPLSGLIHPLKTDYLTLYPTPQLSISEQLSLYPALHLFYEQTQHTLPHFQPTPDVWPLITAICQDVEGSPLALILAASCLAHLSCEQLAKQVRDNILDLDHVTPLTRDTQQSNVLSSSETENLTPPILLPQRGLAATCAVSWQLLTDDEQHMWKQLSIFAGGFSFLAAVEVTQISVTTLRTLVNKSLLNWQEERYNFHPLLHHFAQHKLAQDPQQAQRTADAHAHYYLHVGNKGEWLTQHQDLIAEKYNIICAWQWCTHTQQYAVLSRALLQVRTFFMSVTHSISEGITLLEETLQALQVPPHPIVMIQPLLPHDVAEPDNLLQTDLFRAQLQIALAYLSYEVFEPAVWQPLLDEALPIVKEKDPYVYSDLLMLQGVHFSVEAAYHEAYQTLGHALSLRPTKDVRYLSCLYSISINLHFLGGFEEAKVYLQQAKELIQSHTYPPEKASYIFYLLGWFAYSDKDFTAAEQYFLQLKAQAEAHQNTLYLISAHNALAEIYRDIAQYDKAYQCLIRALSYLGQQGASIEMCMTQATLASVHVACGATDKALILIQEMVSQQHIHFTVGFELLWVLLEAWCKQGNYSPAQTLMHFLLTPKHKQRLNNYHKQSLARILWQHRRPLQRYPTRADIAHLTLNTFLAHGPDVFEHPHRYTSLSASPPAN